MVRAVSCLDPAPGPRRRCPESGTEVQHPVPSLDGPQQEEAGSSGGELALLLLDYLICKQ